MKTHTTETHCMYYDGKTPIGLHEYEPVTRGGYNTAQCRRCWRSYMLPTTMDEFAVGALQRVIEALDPVVAR